MPTLSHLTTQLGQPRVLVGDYSMPGTLQHRVTLPVSKKKKKKKKGVHTSIASSYFLVSIL